MTVEAFEHAEHAMAHSTGMAHANIDQLLARRQVLRKVALSVPGFHVLPMLIPNSDLVAIVPGMLAEAYASHLPIKVFRDAGTNSSLRSAHLLARAVPS